MQGSCLSRAAQPSTQHSLAQIFLYATCSHCQVSRPLLMPPVPTLTFLLHLSPPRRPAVSCMSTFTRFLHPSRSTSRRLRHNWPCSQVGQPAGQESGQQDKVVSGVWGVFCLALLAVLACMHATCAGVDACMLACTLEAVSWGWSGWHMRTVPCGCHIPCILARMQACVQQALLQLASSTHPLTTCTHPHVHVV